MLSVLQILEHKPDFSSWFIGKEIASNGKIFYFTVFDPIYIVLERLRVIAQKYVSIGGLIASETMSLTALIVLLL